MALALLASCRREPTPTSHIVVATVALADGTLRLRDARNGAVVRELGDPCGDRDQRFVYPSPRGDALFIDCDRSLYRVALDGGPTTGLGTLEIESVSGDGKLVWGRLPDGTTAFLHADGSGHTPMAPGTVSFPVPNRRGFIGVVPVTQTLTQIVYVPGTGARVTPIPLEPGVKPNLPLVSLAPDAPLVISLERGQQHFLARVDHDGRLSELAAGRAHFEYNAVNHEYVVYYDLERVYRLALQPGAVPVVVLEHRDTSGLSPKAFDSRGRLLLAGRSDLAGLGEYVCIDVATGQRLGKFRLEGEIALAPLIEI